MNLPKNIRITIYILISILAVLFVINFFTDKYLPYVLDFTKPVKQLSYATILSKNNDNTLTVLSNNHKIRVKLTNETLVDDFDRGLRPDPRLLTKKTLPVLPRRSLSDLRVNSHVTINTVEDLRKLRKLTVIATNILMYPPTTQLTGTIKSIQNNIIIFEGHFLQQPTAETDFSTRPADPVETTYTIMVNNETEISLVDPRVDFRTTPVNENTVLRYTLEDLKKEPNLNVRIYTVEDVIKNKTVTALRIEPFIMLR